MTLEEKVELLINVVTEDDKMAKLGLSYDWNRTKINKIYGIMTKYWDMPEPYTFKYTDVERDFSVLDIDYQLLKVIILTFYENDQFLEVIKQYLETNYSTLGNVSSEYNSIFNQLGCKTTKI